MRYRDKGADPMADQADNRAPYAQIAAHYAELITSGELQPGSLLPSIKNLSQEWSVSAATAEKALRKLRNEGLVRGIHGIGTEVLDRPAPMSSGSQRQDRGRRTGSSWGTGERSDSHQASVVPAPADVAQALDLKPGSSVIRRSRVYRDRHGIVAHSTSWIPARYGELIPQLTSSERLVGGRRYSSSLKPPDAPSHTGSTPRRLDCSRQRTRSCWSWIPRRHRGNQWSS